MAGAPASAACLHVPQKTAMHGLPRPGNVHKGSRTTAHMGLRGLFKRSRKRKPKSKPSPYTGAFAESDKEGRLF
ncbi:hypothetical protein CENSYa_1731 [Cenarchaeum symbiosum A]|uniref:Uncharacterized protein n=1 Tax=Cenarchaeum symbiosum (strain A) TaxID=414004 RepID=A0RYC5_CENSY|nr:hypothetical protein CENSYa_1731 [Cenarchaeum symbiosum A]